MEDIPNLFLFIFVVCIILNYAHAS